MDTEYIKETVGKDLVNGLVALARAKPENPVEFLGQYLVNVGVARETGQLSEFRNIESKLAQENN